jgi:hypothetical protein
MTARCLNRFLPSDRKEDKEKDKEENQEVDWEEEGTGTTFWLQLITG